MNASETGMLHLNDRRFDSIRSVENAAKGLGQETKLKEACRDFEAIFIKQMLDSMKKTVQKTGLMEGGMAEDIFEDMLYHEYAKTMAKTGSFGISDMLLRQFKGDNRHSL